MNDNSCTARWDHVLRRRQGDIFDIAFGRTWHRCHLPLSRCIYPGEPPDDLKRPQPSITIHASMRDGARRYPACS